MTSPKRNGRKLKGFSGEPAFEVAKVRLEKARRESDFRKMSAL